MSRPPAPGSTEPLVCLATVVGRVSGEHGLKIPRLGEHQMVTEGAGMIVLEQHLENKGQTPVMMFKDGKGAPYSVFMAVAMYCRHLIDRSSRLVANLIASLDQDVQESAKEAFSEGGAALDDLKLHISVLFTDLAKILEKRKTPADPYRCAMIRDDEFMRKMTTGLSGDENSYSSDGWSGVRAWLEHHRAVARMEFQMYAEVLLATTRKSGDDVQASDAIGVRYTMWLINHRNDSLNGDTELLTFDHALQALIVANQNRVAMDQRLLLDKKFKRGREEPAKTQYVCENVTCLFNDVLRRVYPLHYGVNSQIAKDMRSDEFRAEFTLGSAHGAIAPISAVVAKIVDVSEKLLAFEQLGGRGQAFRKVACYFKDHFGLNTAVQFKERSMYPEQWNPLSYIPSGGPGGLDAILDATVELARVLVTDGYRCDTSVDGLVTATRARQQLLSELGVGDTDSIACTTAEVETIMHRLDDLNPCLAAKIQLLIAHTPWKESTLEPVSGATVQNPWYCGDVVSFKTFFQKLSAYGAERSKPIMKRIQELRASLASGINLENSYNAEAMRIELLDHEKTKSANFEGCEILKSIVVGHPDYQGLSAGFHCEVDTMPTQILHHCFWEIHVPESFPNRDGRFADGERRQFFLQDFGRLLQSYGRARVCRSVFAGADSIGSGMISGIHGPGVNDMHEMLQSHETVVMGEISKDTELHTVTDLTKTSPLFLWGEQQKLEFATWKTRFSTEIIDDYEASWAEMMMNAVRVLFDEVYVRPDMCERSCALRESAVDTGIFGSVVHGTLNRVCIKNGGYDPTMEPSVNAKQVLMSAFTSGHRHGFTQRPCLTVTMAVLTSADPTIGSGTARRQMVHCNILGEKGLGKSMIHECIKKTFPQGFVKMQGRKSAGAHRSEAPRTSFHVGADLNDEGNAEERRSQKRGANKETGSDAMEEQKSRMSAGETHYTMTQLIQLPSGETVLGTHETVSHCRQVLVTARNDTVDEMLAPLADRAINVQLVRVQTHLDPDEFAADEPVYNSIEYHYQEGIRKRGSDLVGQTALLLNIFGALSGFGGCIPGVDVSAICFVRSTIARVLERNGQPRFAPRMTSKVIEMMKVSSMLGVALEVFWDPWGLFSENAVKLMGGAKMEFSVTDLVRDPQLPIIGMMYADFQDVLPSYIQLLSQDRLNEVNAVRSAFVDLVKGARLKFSDLFGDKSYSGQYTCNLNVIKIPVDQNAKTDWLVLRCIAVMLKKRNQHGPRSNPLDGQSVQQIAEILTFLMEDERYAYQRHPDTLDVLMVPEFNFGTHVDGAQITLRAQLEHNRLLRLAKTRNIIQDISDVSDLTDRKLDQIGKMWAKHKHGVGDDSPGLFYFPNTRTVLEDPDDYASNYDQEQNIEVKTLDISTASNGFVGISTYWVWEGMRIEQNPDKSAASLQQQIIDDVVNSATNSGFYATQGIGMTNIKAGAPGAQDVFYVGFKDKMNTMQNTNYISAFTHEVYGEAGKPLPSSMQKASKSLEPLVPDSLQNGMRAWENLASALPAFVRSEHLMAHCDKRFSIIVAPYLLDQTAVLFEQWCRARVERTINGRDQTGKATSVKIRYEPSMMSNSNGQGELIMPRKHLRELLMFMLDAHPESSPFGYRHLCRHYLHASDTATNKARDMHSGEMKENLFVRFKNWLCGKLITLYEVQGEGQLVFNAMNQASHRPLEQEIASLHTEFNRLQETRGNAPMSLKRIEDSVSKNGELGEGYTFEQSRIRLKIIAKKVEVVQIKKRVAGLTRQISNEMGNDVNKYKSYLQSRKGRDDRPGAHGGEHYLSYIRTKATAYHLQRQHQWPQVIPEYN